MLDYKLSGIASRDLLPKDGIHVFRQRTITPASAIPEIAGEAVIEIKLISVLINRGFGCFLVIDKDRITGILEQSL